MCALAIRSAPRRVAKPKSDPRFIAMTDQVKAGAAKLKKHAPPAQKAREASKSAKAPPNERAAGAKAKVVDEVKEAPTPRPQPQSFKALLRAEIDKAMPKTLGDTEKFMNGGAADGMKGALDHNVDAQKETAAGPVETAARKPPNEGAIPAQPSAALPAEPRPAAPTVDGGSAMPPPVTPAEASLQQSKQDTAQALADEKIKPESLARANDPRFSALAGAQGAVASQADKAPAAFRAKETGVLAAARAQAGATGQRGALLLAGTRGAGNAKVLSRQQQQAAKEEAERKKVAADIEAIYADTKLKVETNLGGLDDAVSAIFDPGVEAAIAAMKTFVDDRLFDYKLRRYLSIPVVGLGLWLKDQALGLPDEVNRFYVEGRGLFQSAMDRLIDRVAALVESRLAKAKADVATGQARIKAYVAGLPANLKAAGDAAAQSVAERFTELESGIESKKNELASSLAQKYKEAFDKADEALKQMQDENKGLLQRFADALGEVLKALLEFKAKLMAVIRKGQETIQLILDDPIGFLGNLIAAVKGGFSAFVANIWTHLQAGFMKWLFGALSGAGIEVPADLSLPSIFKLVMGVLGITYERMRAKAVKLIGNTAVTVIEKVVEYVKELVTGGPQKLWEKVKEDLAALKEMVIGAIQDWLIETVVKQAVAKVVSMFNPAGAIVQAIIAIYNVVMFVIEKAQQILALVEAVVNSVHAIATGAIGGAIAWIERSLASTLPIVIGFLARLVGLGGISEKIKAFILKVQTKVDKAIDKAIAKIVALVKKLFGAVKAGAKKLLNWWKKKKGFALEDGERHTLLVRGAPGSLNLAIRSDETPYGAMIDAVNAPEGNKAAARATAKKIDDLLKKEKGGPTSEATENGAANAETLEALLDTLAVQTVALLPKGKTAETTFGGTVNGFGRSALKTINHQKDCKGGTPAGGGGNAKWTLLAKRKTGGTSYYIQGHLLNAGLGGSGTDWANLTPLTTPANNSSGASHYHQFEKHVVAEMKKIGGNAWKEKGKYLTVKVAAMYGRDMSGPIASVDTVLADSDDDSRKTVKDIMQAETGVPQSLSCTAQEVTAAGAQRTIKQVGVSNPIDTNPKHYLLKYGKKKQVNLKKAKPGDVDQLTGLSDVERAKVKAILAANGKFPNKEQAQAAIGGDLWHKMISTAGYRVVVK
ncbi:phage tail protein [Derxia gummosa]|uniref:Phage tail protein n=1 Tax=Derxia gummosa DSM 723 TaxID=1121388 RepID=A0A8B6X2M3_9BURK|nr:hypothetical protein [Derxia gummosa]